MLEYETAEMAEEAQQQADGLALGGSHLRVSFCAPGPPGRSMLAALIAAQATVSLCGQGWRGGDGSPMGISGPWRRSELLCSCRPSIGGRDSSLSPTSCSCSTTWAHLPPSSCCSTPCSTAVRGGSRVRWGWAGAPTVQNGLQHCLRHSLKLLILATVTGAQE